jgi:hypothetical protein
MPSEKIQEGFDVFLHDGEHAFGAVRHVSVRDITVYIENGGDFVVPMNAVQEVHDEKVILDGRKIDKALAEAIRKAHIAEDPRIP